MTNSNHFFARLCEYMDCLSKCSVCNVWIGYYWHRSLQAANWRFSQFKYCSQLAHCMCWGCATKKSSLGLRKWIATNAYQFFWLVLVPICCKFYHLYTSALCWSLYLLSFNILFGVFHCPNCSVGFRMVSVCEQSRKLWNWATSHASRRAPILLLFIVRIYFLISA